jgi:hypothetical protein
MPIITDSHNESGSTRAERGVSENTPAVFGEVTQDSPETALQALADATFDVVAIREGS